MREGDMKVNRIQPYPLRLQPAVRNQVEKKAKASRWSLNTWLQVAVEEKLEREQQKEAAK
jgi:predicted HicB family RNase H-like nuclease